MTTYVFPGQGAQKLGMGKDLFPKFPQLVALADDVLGYSLEQLCLEDPDKQLNLTQYTQPALFAVSAMAWLDKQNAGEPPASFLAGHSLGEYTALFAAGTLDFETGLRLVQKRGALMAEAGSGGMAAVMNITLEEIHRLLAEHKLEMLDVANFNAPSQIVISGPKEAIERAAAPFENAGARYVVIKVNTAFHSRYMDDARLAFEQFMKPFSFHPPKVPVIANVTARPHAPDRIAHFLAEQITSSVNWVDSIRYLMGQGQTQFVECGPGRVLTGLIRKIRKDTQPLVERIAPRKMTAPEPTPTVSKASRLGSEDFRETYGTHLAYMASSIERGVTSADFVIRMARARLLAFYGSAGLSPAVIGRNLEKIQAAVGHDHPYGISLVGSRPETEMALVELLLKQRVRVVEASNYLQLSPALVKYRVKGLHLQGERLVAPNSIIARVSRPEVATLFMSPPPTKLLEKLQASGDISPTEAQLATQIPMAWDICAVADSGGPTDQAVAYALMPAMLRLREEMTARHGYRQNLRIGAAGGIGTPQAVAAAFVLGADFIATGSINQATVETDTSEAVKELLVQINVQDTTYAPAGEMFEMGGRIQVLKRGLFFPARANKLHALYHQYASLDEIDEKNRRQLQDKYFKRSFDAIWSELRPGLSDDEQERAVRNPKYKMLQVFKWYFTYSWELAQQGREGRVDYQIYCGPAMGAFNQWVRGTAWEGEWRTRHGDEMALRLMEEAHNLLLQRLQALS